MEGRREWEGRGGGLDGIKAWGLNGASRSSYHSQVVPMTSKLVLLWQL